MMQRTSLLAGRGERILANMLDTVILLPASWTLARLLSFTHGAELLPVFALNLLYYVAFLSSPWQATPGKRLLGIYVVHANGTPLSVRDALERFLAFILPSLPIYSSLLSEEMVKSLFLSLSCFWFMPMFFTQERTGMHDVLCRTRVVSGRAGDLWAQSNRNSR